MQIEIFRDKVELGEAQENFIKEKIEHLINHADRMSDEATFIRVDVLQNKIKTSDKKMVVQITIKVPHGLIRAEDSGVSMEEALRCVCEKLDRQIEKYKAFNEHRSKKGDWIESSTLEMISGSQDEYSATDFAKISKKKVLQGLEVLSAEEAANQMELLGHDFFVYKNIEDEKIHVVYKRTDDSYGVIEVDESI